MTITINSFVFEISTAHIYVRVPFLGEAFIDFTHPVRWSCWNRPFKAAAR